MTRLLLVANPAARAFTGGLYRRIKALLDDHHDVAHVWPNSTEEVVQHVADAATRGIEIVAVMGGDGVVHHAAQALVGGSTALAVIPAGTANVLAKLLDLPERPVAAARLIGGGRVERVPVARVTLGTDAGTTTHYATFNVGLGYDADVVARAEAGPERKARLGALHYAGNALQTVWGYRRRGPTMSVELGRGPQPAVMVAVQLHQAYTYFGPVPMIVGSDHPLSGIVVERLTMASASTMAIRSFRARIDATDSITRFDAAPQLSVEAPDGVPAQADGEWLGFARTVRVELVEHALPVIVDKKRGSGKGGTGASGAGREG